MKRKVFIGILIVFTIALGFLRDYIFVSLNYFIDSGSDVSDRLILLKWVLTFVFSSLYLLNTAGFLYVLFQNKKYIWLAVFSYALLVAAALFFAAFAYFFTSFKDVYPLIRAVLGVAQSPVVLMVLIPACLINAKIQGIHQRR